MFRTWVERGNKINTSVQRIDPTGVVHDRWDMVGCFISNTYWNVDVNYIGFEGTQATLNYDHCNHTNFI